MIEMMKEKSVLTHYDGSTPHYRAQLIADTAAELAGVTEQGGVVWDFGSIAHAVDDACILSLDSNDDWVIQTGDNAGQTVDAVIAAASVQSSPRSEQGEQRKNDGIDLEKVLDEDEEDEEGEEPTDEKKEIEEPEPEPERKESGELKEVSGDDKSE